MSARVGRLIEVMSNKMLAHEPTVVLFFYITFKSVHKQTYETLLKKK